LKIKSRPNPPSTAEDWRWLTDFDLTIKSIPLGEALAQIKSADGLVQPGVFNLVSQENIPLPGGEAYILHYSAIKPTKNMLRLKESEMTIFVAGNKSRSISYIQYNGRDLSNKDKEKAAIYRNLFLSFSFLN